MSEAPSCHQEKILFLNFVSPLCRWFGPFVFCFWQSHPFFPHCSPFPTWAGLFVVALLRPEKYQGRAALYRLRKVCRSWETNLQWDCAKIKGESKQEKKRQESRGSREEEDELWKEICAQEKKRVCTLSNTLCCGLHHGLKLPWVKF